MDRTAPSAISTEYDVSVVILNWNAAEDTLRCVQALATWQQLHVRLFVVDNHSAEDDRAQLAAGLPPQATLIANPENLGFSGGTNRGIMAALEEGDAPILLLNNDAGIAEADLRRLLADLHREPAVGIVGPVIYHAAPPHAILSAGNRSVAFHQHTLIAKPPPGAPLYAVDYVSGSVALMRAEMLRTVGLLDEDYFFHTEVADLCHRARRLGWRCVVDGQASAYHNLERSSSLRSTLYTYYLVRNRLIFVRKAYRLLGWLLIAAWALYSLLLAGKLALQGQRAASRAVRLGLADGLSGRWGGQNDRVLAAFSPATGTAVP